MHTPIEVKPVAGSKEWREAWQKRAFAHISNGYKYIYIALLHIFPPTGQRMTLYVVFLF